MSAIPFSPEMTMFDKSPYESLEVEIAEAVALLARAPVLGLEDRSLLTGERRAALPAGRGAVRKPSTELRAAAVAAAARAARENMPGTAGDDLPLTAARSRSQKRAASR